MVHFIWSYVFSRVFKTSKPEDFFKALDYVNNQLEKSHLPKGVSFKDVGKQWTQQAGSPLVTVTRDYASGTVYFKQEPYFNNTGSSRWWIPLSWTTASSLDISAQDGPQDWFYEDKSIQLNLRADEWILVNINTTGEHPKSAMDMAMYDKSEK